MMTTDDDDDVAKPRLVRPLISRNISESERDTALTFHCEPVTSSSSSSSSSSAGEQQSLTSITWYINAEPLTRTPLLYAFLPPPRASYVVVVVCLFVCLFVCCQLCAKTSEQICMKFLGKVDQ